MCGIAGIAADDRQTIERMTAALVHRGPDGNAIRSMPGGSLGHARLAILDPRPEGDQPMWNDVKTVAIVHNGEIVNFRELRSEENFDCRTNTDTEVILKLYEKYGMDFVPRLRGMFAFALFDTRNGSWHLARDAGGIKPLFVAFPNGKLHFASEMRSLLRSFSTKPTINNRALSAYLRLQYVPGPETMCEGIETLPPGTILSWKDGRETRRSFVPKESIHFRSIGEFKEGFPELMDAVVQQHLVSDKPVGLFLSGGMDSSVTLHHMARNVSGPVKTFTVRFDARADEDAARFNADAELAALTAKHYGTAHTEVFLSAALFRDWYAATAQALDQPNADSVSVAQFLLAREAKKSVDVVLTGAGGDELFGGYPRYRVARMLDALRLVPGPVRGAVGSLFGYPSDVLAMSPGPALAERLLARPLSECASIVRGDWFDRSVVTQLFVDRFKTLSMSDPVRAFMEFDRSLWLVDESLRLADGTTMGSGLEARVPFVDLRPLAASMSVASSSHVGFRRTKALLKDTYKKILPPHLFTLPKSSFYPPLAKWFRRECFSLVEESVEHQRIGEYFNRDMLRSMAEAHREKKAYNLHALSSVVQLAHWFSAVYDGE